jgi:CRISPR-associated endonuclease Csn1
MKKILGLDLGSTSVGWALVNESEKPEETCSIIKTGVRVIPLSTDELGNFEKGKAITTNQERTLKRSARRNLQRYKLRRKILLEELRSIGFIDENTILSEDGKHTTFQLLQLRAKAATEKVSKIDFSRVLLTINKKRGYKSSRKVKSEDEGQLVDGMEIAIALGNNKQTPGEYVYSMLMDGKKVIPEFYRSDLEAELKKVWDVQKQFYPEILTDTFFSEINGKGHRATSAIFWNTYAFNTAEIKGTREEKKIQSYKWRADAINTQLTKEEVAYVITEINSKISNSSGYLGDISDRSKELFFNKQTVGQCLWEQIKANPHTRLKGQVFYRKDYENEFDTIWEEQSKHYPELTDAVKKDLKDITIFYQRRLKSQKGLISICVLEGKMRKIGDAANAPEKLTGPRVIPKSSPLFQEFRIWQRINDLEIYDIDQKLSVEITQEHKDLIYQELNVKKQLSDKELIKLVTGGKSTKGHEVNFKSLDGNRTNAALFNAYQKIVELSGHDEFDFPSMNFIEIYDVLVNVFEVLGIDNQILKYDDSLTGKEFENQPYFQFWHLLYSYEGDNSKTGIESLLLKLKELYGFDRDYAKVIANVVFEEDHGNLSSKAIGKLLPHLKKGLGYSEAAKLSGYNHSNSLTKEENDKRELKDKLEILSKNSLRNPVVEKILNQTIHVVNGIIEEYGQIDEIRVELARELKKSAKQREDLAKSINDGKTANDKIRKLLTTEFGLSYVSKNDIIRYKLYKELEHRGYKTLYSNNYVSPDKLFSKEFDIEHIIPQSRMFDDSLGNKTLETRDVNIEKSDKTAYDYIFDKLGEKGVQEYEDRVTQLYKLGKDKGGISKTKFNNLLKKGDDIGDGFISRDLKNTQYVAKKAVEILSTVSRKVTTTTGKITDRLREDWGLISVMQELNWEKYDKLGLTYYIKNKEGKPLKRIKDWTKRNDHRHHAMDAITVAFTRPAHIQYLNNLNSRQNKEGRIYGIEQKYLDRDNGKLKFKPPLPLNEFRQSAKEHLENTLISFKAKNKVATKNKNKKGGTEKPTPRGQLHLETVYGSIKQYETGELKIGTKCNEETLKIVAKEKYRLVLLERLKEFGNDPKKAFSGKNALSKNPVYLNSDNTKSVPEKVKTVKEVTVYTIRKAVGPDLNVEKVIDVKIKKILKVRLDDFEGNPKKAFVNLDENPIWLNEEKGILIKSVTISGVSNPISIHSKRDKNGELILDENGNKQPVDFVNTGNNHHVAIYKDEEGNLQENVVSFFEATERVNADLPVVDKNYNAHLGWEFQFTLKQNEYFVFPNEATGFDPASMDLLDANNYHLISPNLFRVQKLTNKDYMFRHHLETQIDLIKELKTICFNHVRSPNGLKGIIKLRLNHLGKIVFTGEY